MNRKSHAVDSVLILLIFTIFAVSSLFLVIIGANAYRGVVRDSDQNDQIRSSLSYVVNKVRAGDSAGAVRLTQKQGVAVLELVERSGEQAYSTYLYFYQGEIRELFQQTDGEFQPEKGLLVSKADRFSMEQEGQMLFVTVEAANSSELTAQVCLRSEEQEG